MEGLAAKSVCLVKTPAFPVYQLIAPELRSEYTTIDLVVVPLVSHPVATSFEATYGTVHDVSTFAVFTQPLPFQYPS